MSAIWQTQKAIYIVLSGDSSLSNMVNGVYGHVPQNVDFPYVVLSDARSIDFSNLENSGEEIDFEIKVFSSSDGKKEALEIIQRIKILLDGIGLTIANHSHIYTKFMSSNVSLGGDGEVYEGNIIFKIGIMAN